ncbi:unnamed protein product [Mycena citricolor]|uniref:Zn(2)-C6 fungal-type domain-containing protein n=1 Tax=Mycena citricolor TaxID=2018698 RepID=A0AAD2H0V8_9AGAR|nr:unnamed protein product [Mycena citricolor]
MSSSRTPQPSRHGTALRRGKACLNCRHLKIKCDGERPVCGPCTRVPKDDPCEFTDDGTSRTVELENTIVRLQSRIDELEDKDLPPRVAHPLLDAFWPHMTEVGYFLHPSRLQDVSRPPPALLFAVYLWSAQLTGQSDMESTFLRRAQTHLATETSSASFLYTIQAHVLLSTYMLRNCRLVEAEYYASGAGSLALGYHLNASSHSPLDGEQIRGFWAVVTLQSMLGIAISILDAPGVEISTPMSGWEEGYSGSAQTLQAFLYDDVPGSLSAATSQAAVLLHYSRRQTAGADISWLDSRIARFWSSLPPIAGYPLAHGLAATATIHLHRFRATADSRGKRIYAATSLVGGPRAMNPGMPALIALGCDVLMDEMREAESGGGSLLLLEKLQVGITALRLYAENSPLARYHLGRILQQHAAF